MAISAKTVWECRTDGTDTNSSGFVSDATGVDYSQQAAAQYTGTNLTVDASTNTDVLPDGHTPVAADVGNLVEISAGTGFTLAVPFQIVSIQSGKWRLDRSPAATTTAGGTWSMGGAKKSHPLILKSGVFVTGNICWLRGGATPSLNPFITTVNTAGVANGKTSCNVKGTAIGYGTVRGDNGRAYLKNGVNTTGGLISFTGGVYTMIRNLVFDGNKANFTGAVGSNGNGTWINCSAYNWSAAGFSNGGALFLYCDAYNCGTIGFTTTNACLYCVAHDNGTFGFSHATIVNCLAYNNASGGFTGVSATVGSSVHNCVAYNNTGPGFTLSPITLNNFYSNCIAYGNSTYGYAGGDSAATLMSCAYGANTTLNVQNSGLIQEIGSILLTQDPFVNGLNSNYNLNAYGLSKLADKGIGMLVSDGTQGVLDIGLVQRPYGVSIPSSFNPIINVYRP